MKKLVLNKVTISRLNTTSMQQIAGGRINRNVNVSFFNAQRVSDHPGGDDSSTSSCPSAPQTCAGSCSCPPPSNAWTCVTNR